MVAARQASKQSDVPSAHTAVWEGNQMGRKKREGTGRKARGSVGIGAATAVGGHLAVKYFRRS